MTVGGGHFTRIIFSDNDTSTFFFSVFEREPIFLPAALRFPRWTSHPLTPPLKSVYHTYPVHELSAQIPKKGIDGYLFITSVIIYNMETT